MCKKRVRFTKRKKFSHRESGFLSFPETLCPSPGISSLAGRPRGGSGSPGGGAAGSATLPGRAQVGLSGPRWSPAQHGSCPVRQALPAQPQAAPPTSGVCLCLKRKARSTS